MTCPTPAEVEARLDPREPAARAQILLHAEGCTRCRPVVDALLAFNEPETIGERRDLQRFAAAPAEILQRTLRTPERSIGTPERGVGILRGRRWLAPAGGIAAVAAAAAVLLWPAPDPESALTELQGGTRAQETAISDLPWARYEPRRGAADDAAFDRPLRKLLEAREQQRPGADRVLAMLFLLRGSAGDAARIDKALLAAAPGAAADNDRGVVLYARSDFEGALELFDRALAQDARHRWARFNRGLALERLGLRELAADAFDKLADDPSAWAKEAAERARRMRLPRTAPAPSTARLGVIRALVAAATPEDVARARALLDEVPAGLVTDLVKLAAPVARQTSDELSRHGERWKRYLAVRERALRGGADPLEAEAFATSGEVTADPLLWAPALQLAGYVRQSRGEWRAAERFDAAIVRGCRRQPCAVENEAIALDELSDAASRGGDFAAAHELQDRAEALLAGVDAEVQLAELHRKRAALLASEGRRDEAAAAAGQAVRALLDAPDSPDGLAMRAMALEQAATIAWQRGHPRSAVELGQAALALARRGELGDVEVEAAINLAESSAALGQGPEARARLEAAIAWLEPSGHANSVATLRSHLASLLESSGDAAAALAEAERGLAGAGSAAAADRVRLSLAHARALRRLDREPDAIVELSATLDDLAHVVRGAPNPAGVARAGDEVAAELASALLHAGRPAEEVALPLDSLRAAMLAVEPLAQGWSRALAPGACVLAILPSNHATVAALISREGAEGRVIEVGGDALAALPPAEQSATLLAGVERGCSAQLWIFAGAPLDRSDLSALPLGGKPLGLRLAVGVASSLRRMLAPEEHPENALLVRDAQVQGDAAGTAVALPSTAREAAALEAALGPARGLSGPGATPEAVLAQAPAASLLHFAVHGFDGDEGGSLTLSGPAGRLSGREIERLRLRRGARVVLSACEAAAPGPRGLPWAFARAGAVAVAAARGRVDDAAAARWAEVFYPALARGESFAQANREAVSDPRAAWFVVMK